MIIHRYNNIEMYTHVYNENEQYKKSKYCIEYINNGVVLLYSFLTCNLVSYKQEEFSKYIKKLIDLKFYVPVNYNEEYDANFIRNLMTTKKTNRVNNLSSYTIMTTMDCNANCYYCYEKNRNKINMPDKIAEDVADYIIKTHKGDIKLQWFGGEPLYNEKIIDIITHKLKKINCNYKSSMITNGFLFNDENIKKCKNEWNLHKVQITLDGINDVYNKVKKIDSENAFNTVINNIEKLLLNDIKVYIRLNVSHTNKNELMDVIDYIFKKFKRNKNLYMYAHEINEYLTNYNNSSIITYKNLIEINNKISKTFKFKPKKLPKIHKTHQCAADKSGVCITPTGKITPCEHYSDSEFIGSIYNDDFDIDKSNEWIQRVDKINGLCDDCPLYPYCYKIKKCEGLSNCNEYIKNININNYKDSLKIAHEQIVKKHYTH